MEFVSWDDELFPTEWKVIKFMFQSTNQKKSPVLEDRFVDFVAHCLGFRHAITCLGDLALGKLPQEKRVGFLPWRNGQNIVKPWDKHWDFYGISIGLGFLWDFYEISMVKHWDKPNCMAPTSLACHWPFTALRRHHTVVPARAPPCRQGVARRCSGHEEFLIPNHPQSGAPKIAKLVYNSNN